MADDDDLSGYRDDGPSTPQEWQRHWKDQASIKAFLSDMAPFQQFARWTKSKLFWGLIVLVALFAKQARDGSVLAAVQKLAVMIGGGGP